MDFDRKIYFGDYRCTNLKKLAAYIEELNETIEPLFDAHPLFKGEYALDYYEYLSRCELNSEPIEPKKVFEYIAPLYSNLPDWRNPGTMINVIPAVNLVSAATSSVTQMFNPNFAQDTYSGNLTLAELESVKYLSQIIGWDWEKSCGVFTFGGTGTNMYATKLALCNADAESGKYGAVKGRYFTLTSKNGHPTHYQICDWLGIGSDSCIEIECNPDGRINVSEVKRVIRENIEVGRTFLGYNMTGGSTNELIVDPIKEIYDLNDEIVKDYDLPYKPMIHVDSVLGWIFLFFRYYDFEKNPNDYPDDVLKRIKSMYDHVFEFKYADTLGVDFHKTGFCPYITSAFVVKDRSKFFNLNPSTSIDLKDMKYGDYNPFYTSLEYSRTGVGPMAALTCLKSLGTNSFCKLVGDLVLATHIFRKRLKDNPHVFMLSDGSEGFATLFLLVPPKYGKLTYSTVFSLTDGQTKEIKDYNTRYGKFVLRECIERKTNFLFTSSRSYTLPGTDIKIGAIKAYPFSIFLTEENAEVLAKEVGESIQRFTDQDGDQACTRDEYFVDMTTAGKK